MTAFLARGFHCLGLLSKNADSQWGHFEKRGFYVDVDEETAPVFAAEYFINIDPGTGLNTSITLPISGDFITAIYRW